MDEHEPQRGQGQAETAAALREVAEALRGQGHDRMMDAAFTEVQKMFNATPEEIRLALEARRARRAEIQSWVAIAVAVIAVIVTALN